MSHRATQWLLVLAVAGLLPASVCRAAIFDFIRADRLDVTSFPSSVAFVMDGPGLVVNRGGTDISPTEFFNTSFHATSSNPAVSALFFITHGTSIQPIHSYQALGSVYPGVNDLLTSRMLPGEELVNTAPFQLLSLEVFYPQGFVGSVVFDVTMTMGGNQARFPLLVNFAVGSQFSLHLVSVDRTSSVPLDTAAAPASWGAIKKLYR